MDLWSWVNDHMPKEIPLQVLPKISWADQKPTYQQAEPAIIDAALRRGLRRPSGNWFVFAASSDVRPDRPFGAVVAGVAGELLPSGGPETVRHSATDVPPRVSASGALPVGTPDTDRHLAASGRCRRCRGSVVRHPPVGAGDAR